MNAFGITSAYCQTIMLLVGLRRNGVLFLLQNLPNWCLSCVFLLTIIKALYLCLQRTSRILEASLKDPYDYKNCSSIKSLETLRSMLSEIRDSQGLLKNPDFFVNRSFRLFPRLVDTIMIKVA